MTIGNSGCFRHIEDPIDNVAEAAATVEEIVADNTPETTGNDMSADVLAGCVRRVRILTWAVVVIAAVLVLKELKDVKL